MPLADCPVKNVMFTKAEFDGEWRCWQLLAFLAVSTALLLLLCPTNHLAGAPSDWLTLIG